MVELRKRPSRDPPPTQPAAKRGSGSGGRMKKVVEKAKEVVGAGESLLPSKFKHLSITPASMAPGARLSCSIRLARAILLHLSLKACPIAHWYFELTLWLGAPAGPPDSNGPPPNDEVAVTKATGVTPETTTTAGDGSAVVGAPVENSKSFFSFRKFVCVYLSPASV
jgi:hypothetical protein